MPLTTLPPLPIDTTMIPFVILVVTLLVYIPLAAILLYVWYKYGENNKAVKIARIVFLSGSVFLCMFMLVL